MLPSFYLGGGALLVGLFLGAWGMHTYQKAEEFDRLQKVTENYIESQGKVSELGEQLAIAQASASANTLSRAKKVKDRVQDTCALSPGFRVLHDQAASNAADREPRNDDPPTTPQDVADTVNENYGTYHQVANRLRMCQGYVRELEKRFSVVPQQ